MMLYGLVAFITFVLSFFLSEIMRRFCLKVGLVDDPNIESHRRQHKQPIPFGGGLAISITVAVIVSFLTWQGSLVIQYLEVSHVIGLLTGMMVLLVGGTYDDRYGLPIIIKLFLPILAATVVVMSGVGVNFITNPFGGVIRLDGIKFELFTLWGQTFVFTLFADLLTIAWLTILMYTTKLLDGLDGLVSSVTVVGATILFFLSLTAAVLQFDTALLLVIVAASFIGFLPYNWNPAKMFLGDAGSLVAGYLLGVIAIIAGGKIATTALVLGLPVIDAIWVIGYRMFWERKSPLSADRRHLHFRLLDAGFSVKQVVILFSVASALFGSVAIFMPTTGKIITFGVLFASAIAVILFIHFSTTDKNETY